MFTFRGALPLSAMVLLASALVLAQSAGQTGEIVGNVQDPNGALVPGAKVVISNMDTGATRETTTNAEGEYRAALLQPGRYKVSVAASGFAPTNVTDVTVNVGTAVNVNVTLKLGSVAETVEVSAPLVEVTRHEPGQVINSQQIQNLPLNGRRFQDFVNLTPTAQTDPSRGQISILGQRGINTSVNIDGADYNQPFFGGIRGGERSNFAPTVPQGAIQEFQVVTAAFSPEFGRSTGGVVTAISKNGTNDIHGGAFYVLRQKELGLKDALNRQSLENRHQFGGAIGGPISKDRMFFFGAAEQQFQKFPRKVFFPLLLTNPRTAGNAEAWDFYKSLETGYVQTNDATTYTGRWDYQFKAGHRLYARYNGSRNNAQNATSVGNNIDPAVTNALSNNGTEQDRTNTVNGQLVSLLSPTVANEFRAQYSKEDRPRPANAIQANVTGTVGRFGTVNFLGQNVESDYRVQIADNLNWQKGTHSFKVGGEFNHINAGQTFGFNQTGVFSLTGAVGGQLDLAARANAAKAANRFDSTAVTYSLQIGNLMATLPMREGGIFAQDSWRVTPAFTLIYGIRWEGQYLPAPEANNTDVINQALIRFPLGGTDPRQTPEMGNQWAPRLGFAWDPGKNGKTVVRGNAGIFYAHTPLLVAAGPGNNFRNPPGDVSISLPFTVPAANPNKTVYSQLKAIGVDLNTFTLDKLPILTPAQIQSIPAAIGIAAANPFFGLGVTTWGPNYKNPRSVQAGLGLEREIHRGVSVYANFNYANTIHLERNRELNLPAPIIRATDKSLRPFFGLRSGTLRPQLNLGAITLRESSARSLYRGGTVGVKYLAKRVQLSLHYTYASNYDDDSNERDAGGFSYENGFNLKNEYAPSNLDAKNLVVGNVLVNTFWGIEVSSLWRFRSGLPFSATVGAGTDSNEDRGGPDRPYSAPGTPFTRNLFRQPANYNTDVRVLKAFKLWKESVKLQFSAEMFNLFNFTNPTIGSNSAIYGLGIDTAGTTVAPPSTFNQIHLANGSIDPNNSVGTPFQFQAGIRLIF